MRKLYLDPQKLAESERGNKIVKDFMNNPTALAYNIEKVAVVHVTKNYGNEAIYPANEASKIFARIASTKTLTRETIALIKKLGYRIDVEASTPEL